MSYVLMDFGAGMARLGGVAIFFTEFYVSFLNESEVTVGCVSAKRAIMYAID